MQRVTTACLFMFLLDRDCSWSQTRADTYTYISIVTKYAYLYETFQKAHQGEIFSNEHLFSFKRKWIPIFLSIFYCLCIIQIQDFKHPQSENKHSYNTLYISDENASKMKIRCLLKVVLCIKWTGNECCQMFYVCEDKVVCSNFYSLQNAI